MEVGIAPNRIQAGGGSVVVNPDGTVSGVGDAGITGPPAGPALPGVPPFFCPLPVSVACPFLRVYSEASGSSESPSDVDAPGARKPGTWMISEFLSNIPSALKLSVCTTGVLRPGDHSPMR